MRLLVTGATGQIGTELLAQCERAGDVVVCFGRPSGDITDRDAVLQAMTMTRPDAVIHTAAMTDVDGCELDPDAAFAVNAIGTRNVAEAAARVGAHVLAISTDYVFDGTKAEPYDEWDEPNPMSVYGRSKLAGEREALAAAPSATVVRTSWLAGRFGTNMVKTLLRLADDGVAPAFVDDQRGCPTVVEDLVPVLRQLAVDRRGGTFHITNQGARSWFEFAQLVFKLAGHDPARVRPITTAELDPPRPAPRPANSVLDNRAMRLSGLPLLPHHDGAIARLVEQLRA